MGDTQCVYVHRVHSVHCCLIVGDVEEYFLKAHWLLSESARGSLVPAVTNEPLAHIRRCDSI